MYVLNTFYVSDIPADYQAQLDAVNSAVIVFKDMGIQL
jgi:hypothetical protein